MYSIANRVIDLMDKLDITKQIQKLQGLKQGLPPSKTEQDNANTSRSNSI